jgi:hypothetical protein
MHVIITNKMKNKKYYIFGTILNPIEKSLPIIIIHAMIIVLHGMNMIQNVHIFRKIILVNDLLNASFH